MDSIVGFTTSSLLAPKYSAHFALVYSEKRLCSAKIVHAHERNKTNARAQAAQAYALIPFTPILVVPREELHHRFFDIRNDNGDEERGEHEELDASLHERGHFRCFLLFLFSIQIMSFVLLQTGANARALPCRQSG